LGGSREAQRWSNPEKRPKKTTSRPALKSTSVGKVPRKGVPHSAGGGGREWREDKAEEKEKGKEKIRQEENVHRGQLSGW